jgi:DNA-binding GntR family transcriptional regulator
MERPATLAPVVVRSAVDEVAERLREAIFTGEIAPGQHLRERDVSAELGVSNIALREAFSRLAEEGLVNRVPRRGAFVAPISAAIVRDLSDVRVVLEQHAAVRAMSRWSSADDDEIERIVSEMELAAQRRDAERMFQLDQAFHAAFWDASGSEALVELATNLRGRIARVIRKSMMVAPDELTGIAVIHRDWLDIVRSGDEARLRAEVTRHITHASEQIARSLEAEEAEEAERAESGVGS